MSIEQLSINTLRTLSIDMIQAANSGHPGAPLGMSPMMYVLWQKFLRHSPNHPTMPNRDRFVLSAGHASALIYAMLHLTGYKDMTKDELKNFRKWGSLTPGHPEFSHTKGLDATTGPLGQGIAMTVGMAIAQAHLAARFNKEEFSIFDNYTYAICGDGDLQEGISHEAAALAGHLKLNKLIWLHDDNGVQLDTLVDATESSNTKKRFESYGWNVLSVEGNDISQIEAAILLAQKSDKPTLIQVRTIIGFGSPRAGTSKAHGEPLGVDGVLATKKSFDWEGDFLVPDEVKRHMDATEKGDRSYQEWQDKFNKYKEKYPDLATEIEAILLGEIKDFQLPKWEKAIATRSASGDVINSIAQTNSGFLGGSADLSGSTKTDINISKAMQFDTMQNRNIYFGVREFAMAAIANGLNLYGLRSFVGTFLVFSDYLKPALRLSALQNQGVVYVLTHDSVGLGEDGPTHQPVEQLAMLRSIPNVNVFRPADANETLFCWKEALNNKNTPSVLALSRQNLPLLNSVDNEGVKRGAYIIRDANDFQATILATGSEVALALESVETLLQENIKVRVVSMPCFELFRQQNLEYKQKILGDKPRLAIEAAASQPWFEWLRENDKMITLDNFGYSAPGNVVMEKLGFNTKNVVKILKEIILKKD